jgi:predicted transcriptional regulator of viral defense system
MEAFREKGGTLRTRDLIALGVHTDALYTLRDSGRIVELGRGLYRLAEADEAEHPDLALVAARAPDAAVCLISALSYHDITTQIPSSVHLAVPRGSYHGITLSIPAPETPDESACFGASARSFRRFRYTSGSILRASAW